MQCLRWGMLQGKTRCIVKLNRHSISMSQPHLSSSRVLHCGILSQSTSREAIEDAKHGIKTNNWRCLLYTLRNTGLRACTSFASLPWLEDEKPKVDALLAMDFVACQIESHCVPILYPCVLSSSTLGSLHGCRKPNDHGLAKIASSARYKISSSSVFQIKRDFDAILCSVWSLAMLTQAPWLHQGLLHKRVLVCLRAVCNGTINLI